MLTWARNQNASNCKSWRRHHNPNPNSYSNSNQNGTSYNFPGLIRFYIFIILSLLLIFILFMKRNPGLVHPIIIDTDAPMKEFSLMCNGDMRCDIDILTRNIGTDSALSSYPYSILNAKNYFKDKNTSSNCRVVVNYNYNIQRFIFNVKLAQKELQAKKKLLK